MLKYILKYNETFERSVTIKICSFKQATVLNRLAANNRAVLVCTQAQVRSQ